jgi:hypothetical protein
MTIKPMNFALLGAQLVAAWSIKLNIAWGRFIVAMVILGCFIIAAAYLDQRGRIRKK